MAVLVQKYGGSSVADVERIGHVADRVVAARRAGWDVVVVVSAMGKATDELLSLAARVAEHARDGADAEKGRESPRRELDMLVSTGERVTMALLSIAIAGRGEKAISFTGSQSGILTNDRHFDARIIEVRPHRIEDELSRGKIVIVAGYQGMSYKREITTLGRGGSDTTGVAIAAALGADVCEIYTDVDGVYTTDPNLVPSARKIERISYEEMLELASLGAKVLQIRSVELGMKYGVPIHVRSSFSDVEGTWVVPEEREMEHVVVSGVTVARDEAKITVGDLPDQAGVAARLFAPLADSGVVVDMIIQNTAWDGTTDLTFTVPAGDRKRAIEILRTQVADLVGAGGEKIATDDEICKVSVVGVGMRSHAGVAKRMFQLLAAENINIQLISTSEIKISCVVAKKYAELALRTLHAGFGLDLPPDERASL